MRFSLAQLLRGDVGARGNYSLDESFEPFPETGAVRVKREVSLTSMDKGILVKGPIETNASSICTRCLTLSEYSVRFRLDEEYMPRLEVESGAPISVQEVREDTFTVNSHHTLNLDEAVRQYTIINTPMKPPCSQNCTGLCSTCGATLNDYRYDCSTLTGSRRSPLLDFLATNQKR
jgi:uncharacterized protein